MDRIEELIRILDSVDTEWKNYFEDLSFFSKLVNGSYMDETKTRILLLVEEIIYEQKKLIDNNEDEDELWNNLHKLSGSDLVVERIRQLNDSVVQPYKNLRLLRNLPNDMVISLIIKVFDNLSINYNPDIFLDNSEYCVDTPQEFSTALIQLDRIVTVHVSRHYDKRTAQKEFLKVSGVNEICAMVYAELYEKNMDRLQHNIFLDKIEELNMKVDQLIHDIEDISKKH